MFACGFFIFVFIGGLFLSIKNAAFAFQFAKLCKLCYFIRIQANLLSDSRRNFKTNMQN